MAEQVIEIRGFEELTQLLGKLGRMDERVYWPLHDAMSQAGELRQQLAIVFPADENHSLVIPIELEEETQSKWVKTMYLANKEKLKSWMRYTHKNALVGTVIPRSIGALTDYTSSAQV